MSKAGSIVGPFEDSGFFVVVEVKEIKKGTMKPFESVNLEIDSIIGAKLLIEIYDKYIEDLRNTVPIDIDYSQVSVKKDLPQVSDEEQAGE